MTKKGLRLDPIGYWSELKLDIIRKYASAYSTILSQQQFIRGHLYIDGFAGAGTHISRTTGQMVPDGDCNHVLLEDVFPKCRYEDFRRALCVLDPTALL